MLQIAASLPAVASTVHPKQYVLPYSLSFASLTLMKKPADCGLELGLFLGSFTVGKALTGPFWRILGKWCGLRAAFQVALLLQVIQTLGFGLIMDLWIATILRFTLGMTSPGLALAPDTLIKHVVRHPDEVPMATTVTTLVHGSVLALGLLLGALDITNVEMPYLAPSLVVVIVSLVAFSVLSVDFLEEEKSTKKQTIKRQSLHFQKFEGESRPQMPQVESHSSEPPADFAHFQDSAPPLPTLIILKNVISIQMQMELDQTCVEEAQASPETNSSERDGKHTHISYLSEDFPQPAKSAEMIAQEAGFDQQMQASESLCTAEYLGALSLYAGLVALFSAVETAGLLWLGLQDYCQGQKRVGIMLGGVLMNVLAVTTLVSACTRSLSIHAISLIGLLGFALGGAMFPYVSLLSSTEMAISAAFVALVIRDCGARVCLTGLVLRLSSSIKPEIRGKAMFWADMTAALAKGLAMIGGPALLSYMQAFVTHMEPWFALFPMLITILAGLTLHFTKSKYSLLTQVPYPI